MQHFFESFLSGFARARGCQETGNLDLRIAGRTIRVHLSGGGLKHLLRPLAHLSPGSPDPHSAGPDLDLYVWDGSAGWEVPPFPWDARQEWYLGEIEGVEAGGVQINHHPPSGLLCMRCGKRAVYWLPDAEKLPFWEIASPFRVIFHWWARSFDAHVAHAAVVGKQGAGVLLTGRSGAGKSTMAIACADAGMDYVGDDYVLLERSPRPMAHALYNSAKMHADFLARAFPHWLPRVSGSIGPEKKSLMFLRECMPASVVNCLPITCVMLPKISGGRTAQLRETTPIEGLLALAPSTIFQLPGARTSALPFFRRWIGDLPVYDLLTGDSIASGRSLIAEFLVRQRANCR